MRVQYWQAGYPRTAQRESIQRKHCVVNDGEEALALGRPLAVLLGVLASRLLASVVYEATPRDPLVLTSAVLAMTLIGLVATWIPARRALRVNPAQLLREE